MAKMTDKEMISHLRKNLAWERDNSKRIQQRLNTADNELSKNGFSIGGGGIGAHARQKFVLDNFKKLWDSIYKNWEANPWVWVITFKRVKS